MYTVLHIDNSQFFNKLVCSCIEKNGFTCIIANDISEGLLILEKQNIDLIISAIEIKGGGGEYLIRQLNSSKFSSIPVIIMTSYDSMDLRVKMFNLGVIDYIFKDRNFSSSLTTFLQKLVEKSSAREIIPQLKFAVIDDSKMQLQLIINIMSLNRIKNISLFTSGKELLASSEKFHIYLVDLVLPDISGEQVILQIRKKYPEAIIIAISGIDNYKVISNVLLSGADDYMLKPFNSSIFMARLISNIRVYRLFQDLKEKNRELEESLINDPLTGLHNHRFIYQQLQVMIKQLLNHQNPCPELSLLFLSIDNFNQINDNYGHSIGDKVLQKVAQVLKSEISDTHHMGRYGGVEFMIFFPGESLEEAYQISEKIRKRVNKLRVKDVIISISGGLCVREGENANDLIKKADTLLFNAKHNGKNRIEKSFDWSIYL